MARSALRDWWGHLSNTQRAILQLAATQSRLEQEPAAQMLADTGCPVRSMDAQWTPSANDSKQVWVMPELLRGFISARA